jgi:glucokinase
MINDINSQAEKSVGVEVSALMLRAVCLNQNGALVNSAKASINSEQEISTQLTNFINELKNQFGDFKKIGVALPGLLNRSTRRIELSKHIPEQTEIDLAQHITAETGVEVILENDANAGAYGEYVMGAGRGSRDVLYVALGTAGVGGAFVFDGKLWHGASGFAGELGYITIDADGKTLEEVASAAGIIQRISTRVHQDKTSSLSRLRGGNMTIADIVLAANNGDGFATMMLERTGGYVGVALAIVINLLNIGKIIVGGEVMNAPSPVLRGINQNAGTFSFKPSFETTEIVAGELGENANAIGAALLSSEAGRASGNM